MTTGIYGIWNSETKECLYIGQSSNIEKRWLEHKKRLRSGRALLEFQVWFDETGRDFNKLMFGILQRCDDNSETKDQLEIQWFEGFSPKFYGRIPQVNQGGSMTTRVKMQISRSLLDTNKSKNFIGNGKGIAYDSTGVPTSERLTAREYPRHELVCVYCKNAFRHRIHFTKYCSKECQGKLTKEQINEIVDLYLTGYSLRQIASNYQVSYVTIRKKLISRKVELRNSHPSNRIDK